MIAPSTLSIAAGAGPQSTGLVPPGVSQKSNDDTHKTPGLCSPKPGGAPAKMLDSYPVSRCDDLEWSAVNSMRALGSFAKDRINDVLISLERCAHFHTLGFLRVMFSSYKYDDLKQQEINAMSFLRSFISDTVYSNGDVPGVGNNPMNPRTFSNVMLSLCESSYQNSFPKKIIGIGSGSAFLEKCFELMNVMEVKCYDKKPCGDGGSFLPVEKATFPKDIEKCLPDDCSDCLLVSGYPKGFLGSVLAEFIRRGGEMFCTTVEGCLSADMHLGYEKNPEVLQKGIEDLMEKSGESFQVEVAKSTVSDPSVFIQFFNWPASVKQSLLDCRELEDLCFDLCMEKR
ncbi:hypothetical protein [Endozoicomonas euniceicola]|uniref:Uncharacterized protein n=1 Tax=Endozoicomonas euniceicola TaxID=1234143 RepID=A0ABY6GWW4_9GAMM|nr:hypothetical protein [Endozoicomonas euniceicola]UYM17277.1 hypothetical protein NX720_04965 [Endozoicomonas euniceicola]